MTNQRAAIRELFENYAELTIGFTSTFPNRPQQKFWVDNLEMQIEEQYGPSVLGLIAALADMAGCVEDDIGEIVDVVLVRAEWCAKQWPDSDEYKEMQKELPIREWARKVREAYVNSNGLMRSLCEQAQNAIGGSIADWERMGYCDNFQGEVVKLVRSFAAFQQVVMENPRAKSDS